MSNRKVHIGQRNASSSRKLNSGSEFYNEYGDLKEGYNYKGGNGTVAVGMGRVGGTRGAGKDGMQAYSEERTIFGPPPSSTKEPERKDQPAPPQQQAPTPPPQPEPKNDLVIQPSKPAPNKNDPGYVDHMPVDPNRDYGESPFTTNETKADYEYTPQAQEAKERAYNFKYNFDRS
jgi:hypothetical protein